MARTVLVRLQAEVSSYVAGIRTAQKSTNDFVGGLDKAAKAGKLDAVADSAARMGLVAAGAFALVVSAAAKFDKQMSAVSAATHASTADMERMRQAALAAGKDTKFSATQAAQGIEELAKAGVSTADIIGGGLGGALALAAAGEMEVGAAAEVAASAMTQFGLAGSKVPHIADLLAAGAGKAQGSVHDMGMALNMSGLVAAQFGLSIEDTVGALAMFAHNGLLGSDAGTSFKQSLLMLASPSAKAAGLMKELGINAYDAAGNFVGVTDLAAQLQTQLGGLTQAQRNAALSTIFGSDAIRVASILFKEGAAGAQEWRGKVVDYGYATDTAARKTDNLAGDIERLTGSLETLAIESGSGANSGLRILAKSLNALVDQFASLPSGIGSAITVLVGLGGAVLLASAAWIKMRGATANALAELANTGPVGTRAASGLQRASVVAGRTAGAFVALQIAAAAVNAAFGKNLNPQISALAQSLDRFGKTGEKSGEAARLLGDDFKHLGYDLSTLDSGFWAGMGNGIAGVVESFTGLGGIADESLQHAKERLGALDTALSQMVTAGNGDAAAAVFAKIAFEARAQGVSVDELKKGLPEYAGALQLAGSASGTAAGGVKAVGDAAGSAASDLDKMRLEAELLANGMLTVRDAHRSFESAIDDAAAAARENGRTLDINTAKGRANEAALDGIASAANESAAKMRELGGTQEEINAVMGRGRSQFLRIADAMGMPRAAARALADSLFAVPKTTSAHVSAPGAVPAKRQVDDFDSAVRGLARAKSTHVSAPGAAGARHQLDSVGSAARGIPPWRSVSVTARGVGGAIAQVQALRRALSSLTSKGVRVSGVTGAGGFTQRWGGITEHAEAGLLREASVFSPKSPARYAFAEPATGGEAFIPRSGDYNRSMAILDRASAWYGAQVTPRGAGGGRGMQVASSRGQSTMTVQHFHLHAGVVGSRMELENWYVAMGSKMKAQGRI